MSGEKISRVTRLVVGKGKTSRPSESEEWLREYYEVEALIEDPSELDIMKANITGLIDGWLSGKPLGTPVSVVTPKTPVEAGTTQHVDYRGQLMARMIQTKDKLSILPIESLGIKADDPAISNFLKPRVLDRMKLNYSIEEDKGLLRAIVIRGSIEAKTIEDLKNPIGWSFEKASSRS